MMGTSFDADNLMYKLVVISDIHHDFARLERLLPVINSADYLVFCGDGVNDVLRIRGLITVPIVCVRGNNDFSSDIAEIAGLKFGDTRALVTHGHKFNVRHGVAQLVNMAEMKNCKLVFYGHTHMYCDVVERGVHLINPGALCNGSYALVAGDGVGFISKQGVV